MSRQSPLRMIRLASVVLLASAAGRAPAQLASRSAQEWIPTLENPNRVAGQKVDEVLAKLQLKPGMVVADIGAGSGVFTRPLAQVVTPGGTVYAVDIQQDLLDYINQRDREAHIQNVKTVLGEFNDPKLPEHDVDLAFINDVLHHIENRAMYLRSLARYMKPSGRIVIIEMNKDDPNTPHRKQPELLIGKEQIDGWLSDAGFKQIQEFPDVFPATKWFLVYAQK
jgi:ubiquinone/menaquinone biosynthesis C-methylase UbiE